MATPATDMYIKAQNGAVIFALRDLQKIWERTGHLDALERRQVLEEYWPLLIESYGQLTAILAVDRFEEITGLDAVVAPTVDRDTANERMRWALSPLFGGAGEVAALALLANVADELIKQPGRDSMIQSANRHGKKFARVPTGAETCSYCLMLASRGFDYHSEEASMRANHGECDCRIAIEGEDTPGYDLDAIYELYNTARKEADSGKPKDILAAMREQLGTH